MPEKDLILCVDDEKPIVNALRRELRKYFDIITAHIPELAVELFSEHKDRIQVVISDLKMPGMGGIELLKEIRKIDEHAVCIILSGQGSLVESVEAINKDLVFRYLLKPWSTEDLINAVRSAIARRKMNLSLRDMGNILYGEEPFSQEMLKNHLSGLKRQAELGFFTSKILHDLNNQSMILAMGMEAILNDVGEINVPVELLTTVRGCLSNISLMIEDVQNFITTRQMGLNLEKTALKAFIEELSPEIISLFFGKDIRLTIDIPPELTLSLDRHKIRRLALNLAKNAGEAMESGQFSISAKLQEEGAVIYFSDDGPGIPDELKEKIFQPYSSNKQKGVGVGLVNVLEIAKLHQSEIQVHSQEGKGTTFFFQIPYSLK